MLLFLFLRYFYTVELFRLFNVLINFIIWKIINRFKSKKPKVQLVTKYT